MSTYELIQSARYRIGEFPSQIASYTGGNAHSQERSLDDMIQDFLADETGLPDQSIVVRGGLEFHVDTYFEALANLHSN